MGAKEKHLPRPLPVDLAKLVTTSALTDPEKFRGNSKTRVKPLPSMGLIEKEIAIQRVAKAKGQLTETNLTIEGEGMKVVSKSKKDRFDNAPLESTRTNFQRGSNSHPAAGKGLAQTPITVTTLAIEALAGRATKDAKKGDSGNSTLPDPLQNLADNSGSNRSKKDKTGLIDSAAIDLPADNGDHSGNNNGNGGNKNGNNGKNKGK